MHELAVTESLLKSAVEYAEKNDAKRVLSLDLLIGDLSGYVSDSVQFYWDIICENTICAHSKLIIERQPARFLCQSCQMNLQWMENYHPAALQQHRYKSSFR
jgi:hydrogenase nickel incorporation protein HypA/HybF